MFATCFQSAPEGAKVSALGLSNKAVFSGDAQTTDNSDDVRFTQNEQYKEAYFSPLTLTGQCLSCTFHLMPVNVYWGGGGARVQCAPSLATISDAF